MFEIVGVTQKETESKPRTGLCPLFVALVRRRLGNRSGGKKRMCSARYQPQRFTKRFEKEPRIYQYVISGNFISCQIDLQTQKNPLSREGGFFCIIHYCWGFGEKTAASADGRRSEETLSQNTSASFGADKEGATVCMPSMECMKINFQREICRRILRMPYRRLRNRYIRNRDIS